MKYEETRELLELRAYVCPFCTVVKMEQEFFICTSVVPKVPGSTEEEWEDEDVEIGEEEL